MTLIRDRATDIPQEVASCAMSRSPDLLYLTNVFRPERCLRSRKHPVSGESSRVNSRHPGPPADPVGVIATVGQHPFRLWQAAQHGTQEPGQTNVKRHAYFSPSSRRQHDRELRTTERSERAARCWIPRPEAENPFAEIIPPGKPAPANGVIAALQPTVSPSPPSADRFTLSAFAN